MWIDKQMPLLAAEGLPSTPTPGHLPCSSLTHPLPLSSRRPSVDSGLDVCNSEPQGLRFLDDPSIDSLVKTRFEEVPAIQHI